jgi:hypothetical protein
MDYSTWCTMNLSLTAQTAATSSMTKRLRVALQALEAIIWRLLGMPLNPPFRNFTTFRSYWIREGASGHGGWQARRDIVEGLLDPFRQELTRQRRSGIPQISVALIATLRDPAAIREQLGRLQGIAQSDPPLAIGTTKELVESTAKMVLQERGLQVDDKRDLPVLIKQAQDALGLHPATAQPGPDGTGAVKRILGGLTSIAVGLGELRNLYGTGHGPKGRRVGLQPRHAQLAVNAGLTLEETLAAFDEHLRRTRGVWAGTRRNYCRFAGAFLQAVFAGARWWPRRSTCSMWSASSRKVRPAPRERAERDLDTARAELWPGGQSRPHQA